MNLIVISGTISSYPCHCSIPVPFIRTNINIDFNKTQGRRQPGQHWSLSFGKMRFHRHVHRWSRLKISEVIKGQFKVSWLSYFSFRNTTAFLLFHWRKMSIVASRYASRRRSWEQWNLVLLVLDQIVRPASGS